MEGSRSAANNADVTYQESVKNLEEARQLWEREMELLCKVRSLRHSGAGPSGHAPTVSISFQQFQALEEQRIAFLRHQMWTYCNLCSQATVSEDEVRGTGRKREGKGEGYEVVVVVILICQGVLLRGAKESKERGEREGRRRRSGVILISIISPHGSAF